MGTQFHAARGVDSIARRRIVGELLRRYVERHPSSEFLILGQSNLVHTALAELVGDSVVGQRRPYHLRASSAVGQLTNKWSRESACWTVDGTVRIRWPSAEMAKKDDWI